MQRTLIASAIGAALATLAGTAAALPLATYVAGADTLEVRISGASAQDLSLEKVVAAVCASGTVNGANQLNNSVYYCTIAPNTAPNPGVSTILTFTSVPASVNKLVLYKNSIGGSGGGVAPVANSQTNLLFLNLAYLAANPSCLGAAVTITSSALPSYTMQPVIQSATCGGQASSFPAIAQGTPDIGISDVEPSLLDATGPQIANLARFEGGHLTFGIPVTRNVRDALQTAQGLPAGSDLAADQPTLTSNQVTAIHNGSITSWGDLGVVTGPALATLNISVAHRSPTSGTTRTYNAYLGTDSGQCVLQARARRSVTSSDTTGSACEVAGTAGIVIRGSGTDNVVRCMAGHQTNNRGAIGVLSMETSTLPAGSGTNAPAYTATDAVRFIKLDGQMPTLLNVANGRYGLWASTSFQYRSVTNALAGDRLEAAKTFRTYLANKAVLSDVNSTISQTFAPAGEVGYLAAPVAVTNVPLPLPIPTFAALSANLTNPFTKVSGGAQNNCQRGIKF